MTRTLAPHSRAALSTIASKTGWRSVGELEITFRISAVAVCCSRASVSSRFRASSSCEQPHVLDGDHRLVGERLEEGDLRVGEGRPSSRVTPIAPIGSPSRSMGTASTVRKPACTSDGVLVLRVLRRCRTWTTSRVRIARPVAVPRSGGRGQTADGSSACGVMPCTATRWIRLPSNRKTPPLTASHSRTALWTIASKTGWTSVGELEMTRRISPSPSAARAPRSARGSAPAAPGTAARSRWRSPPGRRTSPGASIWPSVKARTSCPAGSDDADASPSRSIGTDTKLRYAERPRVNVPSRRAASVSGSGARSSSSWIARPTARPRSPAGRTAVTVHRPSALR